jgi:hypothetical protein
MRLALLWSLVHDFLWQLIQISIAVEMVIFVIFAFDKLVSF